MSNRSESGWPGQQSLQELIEQLTTISTQPAFLELLRELEATPPEERTATATRLGTVENLRAHGIPIPPGFRITTRFFENPEAPLGTDLEPLKEPYGAVPAATTMTVCFSAGLGLCSSVGWGTDLPGGPTLPPPIIHDGLETEHPKPEHP